MTSKTSQQQDLLPMELPLTQYAEGFPAKTLVSREKALDSMESVAVFGRKSTDLLAKFDPVSYSWKTSQTCWLAQPSNQGLGLAEFSGTWPDAGTMRNGETFRHGSWGFLMAESASGLWPTPSKNDGRGFYRISSASAKRRSSGETKRQLHWLHRAILMSGREGTFVANPRFSMELMGFPKSWVDLGPVATP